MYKKGAYTDEIFVDNDLIGLIIGKAGSNIKLVSEKYNVQIFVSKENKEDPEKRKIILSANK